MNASSRSRRTGLAHIDGLDGLRGLAVVAVVLFHAGLSSAAGGFLGVELFFVLSGFLITSLLIDEWLATGTIALSNFWARRARRLLPALFVLVVVIGIYYAIRGTFPGSVSGLFGDGISALFYYSNWHQIAQGTSYFVATGPTSPFQHTWSLAIEEQFYVLWPLLVLGLASLVTWRRRAGARVSGPPSDAAAARLLNGLLGLTLVMIVASAVDAALLFHGGTGLNRVYYGTDSRASGLLAGAILAILMARLRLAGQSAASAPGTAEPVIPPARSSAVLTGVISVASAVVLAAIVVLMVKTNGSQDHWLYPWGLLLVDAMSVALIAVILNAPRAVATLICSFRPLRWVGQISYGLYLWHAPLFLWIVPTDSVHGRSLFAVRVAAALAVSVLSYYLVEQPIRQRRWPVWMIRGLAPITAGAGVVSLALAASAATIPTATAAPPVVRTNLAGTDPACHIRLANTTYTGTVAPPKPEEESFQTDALGHGTVTWPAATTTKTFTTCPPKRALLIGDSIAFTVGVPYLYDEQRYGMAISNAAILGCAFGIRGELNVNGTWEAPPKACPAALSTWAGDATAFGANEIIFELGYRDAFDWKWDGRLVHLGEPAFDSYVERRIREFIRVLGEHGTRKLLFLTIPFVSPPDQPDGSPAPQASTARHTEINTLISEAAKSDGSDAKVLDIDTTLSPAGHYSTEVNGQLCRFDGIHVTVYCSELLEPRFFEAARGLLAAHRHP